MSGNVTLMIREFGRGTDFICMDEVVKIINSPTESERKEEVDLVAADVMVLYGNGNNA